MEVAMADPEPKTTAPKPRPYFLPPGVDLDSLPDAVRLAFDAIIQPSYEELVLAAGTSLERTAGVSLLFLLCLEVLQQFELAHQLNFLGAPANDDQADRDRAIAKHLKLVGAKQQAANFLARLHTLRNKLPFKTMAPLAMGR
jgi:hypothetical protein